MKISEILITYDTDKVNGHCYGDAYDVLFSQFDRNAPLNILEIGTQKGGSLCAWQDYFPNAKVTGIDIVDVVKPEYRRESINYIFADVKDVKLDEEYDIIIDDGSHFFEDVMFVIDNFHSKLKSGGIMIIEDVQSQSWLEHIKVPFSIFDLRHVNSNYDDFLIIIKNEPTR
jgi:trans-aconitate methyltransferase